MTDPNYPQTGRIPSPDKNFAPRLSLAYSLNDKTVVRVGGGLFYAPFIGNGLDTLFLGNGLYQTSISVNSTTTGAPVFPTPVATVSAVPAVRRTSPLPRMISTIHTPSRQRWPSSARSATTWILRRAIFSATALA